MVHNLLILNNTANGRVDFFGLNCKDVIARPCIWIYLKRCTRVRNLWKTSCVVLNLVVQPWTSFDLPVRSSFRPLFIKSFTTFLTHLKSWQSWYSFLYSTKCFVAIFIWWILLSVQIPENETVEDDTEAPKMAGVFAAQSVTELK